MTQQPTVSAALRKRAQDSSNAIARMYISMRHLLNRGFTSPWVFRVHHYASITHPETRDLWNNCRN